MGKVVFRPFWSYDVIKTEQWLSEMHANGLALEKVDFNLRLFYFTEVTAQKYYYRIVFDKKSNGNIAASLYEQGYERVAYVKDYYILRNKNRQVAEVPSYYGFFKRNQDINLVAGILLVISTCLIFALVIGCLLLMSFVLAVSGEGKNAGEATFNVWPFISFTLISGLLYLVMFAWELYTLIRLSATNNKLKTLLNMMPDMPTIPKQKYNAMVDKPNIPGQVYNATSENIANLKLIKKWKLEWALAPDLLEIWLEKMEREGYNLYQVSKRGICFYFIKGEARNIKYCVDLQYDASPGYYNYHKNNGWRLCFASQSSIETMHIWGKEYSEEEPVFPYNKKALYKKAKTLARSYSVSWITLIIWLLLFIQSFWFKSFYFLSFLYGLNILLSLNLAFMGIKCTAYYCRIKKSALAHKNS